MPDQKKILVTGASGFIGKYVCAELLSRGYSVLALVRRAEQPYLAKLGVSLVIGDLLDSTSYSQHLAGVAAVVHLGADATFGNGTHYQAINTHAVQQLIAALADRSPSAQLVFVSTIGAVDRAPGDLGEQFLTEDSAAHPSSDYGRSKVAAERLVQESSLAWTIIRPTLVVGAGMRPASHVAVFARAAVKGGLIARLAFPGRFSLIHVSDLARAIAHVVGCEQAIGRTFFAAGAAVEWGQVFEHAAKSVGLKPQMLPLGFLRSWLKPVGGLLPFNLKALLFDALCADDSRLRALGWSSRISPEQAISEVARIEAQRTNPSLALSGWSVVTGAASGLGEAVARRLAQSGRKLVLVDKDPRVERLSAIAPQVTCIQCHLENPSQVSALQERLAALPEGVDELFLCAGFGRRGSVTSLDEQTQVDMLNTNFIARMRLARWAALRMSTRNFGRIVLISSSSAFQALPYMATYAASNAALLSFGEAFGAECQSTGIQVLTVCPGGMRTAFQGTAGVKVIPNEQLASPQQITDAIFKALASNRTTLVTGPRARAMELLARVLPRPLQVRVWRRLMAGMR